jgi:hypothetical protein
MEAAMDADNPPTQQPYDPLKQFVDDSQGFKTLCYEAYLGWDLIRILG